MAGVGGVGLLVLQANGRLDAIGVAAALGGVLSMASGIVLAKKCSSGRIDQFSVAVESGRCCAGRWLVLGQSLSLGQIAGTAIILAAVLVVTLKPSAGARPTDPLNAPARAARISAAR